MGSKYREINPSAFSQSSTWMNLGLWALFDKKLATFEEANENLARTIMDQVVEYKCSEVIDLGCGRGDSLALWVSSDYGFNKVYGVNSSKEEYLQAAERFSRDKRISLFYYDAFEFLEQKTRLRNFALISVDALYHFQPSRFEFFRAASTSGAKCIAVSDIVLSAKWEETRETSGNLVSALRYVFLSFVALTAGVPRENLTYGSRGLSKMLKNSGWKMKNLINVTENVFNPFAEYCFARARKYSYFSKEKWTLLSSAYFMQSLAWFQATDFIIYSVEPLGNLPSAAKM